uniref:Uncharacterized protein n=1 Tax=Chromera velia CCMP2878 TaxID=1169474 RepID=A0A0G4I8M0_9ALVE|eukprot:Cvel_11888.t1-p1 / transcript=Cvel_11888.t1 / gene=Cvel_11888 / organism=Chromera_velia_CCMP2878 / gene_product=hypothetical protein / transcript_product=hypothetical protein / location=Cvel_scaffold760:9057-13796(+) / protein_length=966 / sequence_SO=supercontig / SO=protein_coding / is_pseudo=false
MIRCSVFFILFQLYSLAASRQQKRGEGNQNVPISAYLGGTVGSALFSRSSRSRRRLSPFAPFPETQSPQPLSRLADQVSIEDIQDDISEEEETEDADAESTQQSAPPEAGGYGPVFELLNDLPNVTTQGTVTDNDLRTAVETSLERTGSYLDPLEHLPFVLEEEGGAGEFEEEEEEEEEEETEFRPMTVVPPFNDTTWEKMGEMDVGETPDLAVPAFEFYVEAARADPSRTEPTDGLTLRKEYDALGSELEEIEQALQEVTEEMETEFYGEEGEEDEESGMPFLFSEGGLKSEEDQEEMLKKFDESIARMERRNAYIQEMQKVARGEKDSAEETEDEVSLEEGDLTELERKYGETMRKFFSFRQKVAPGLKLEQEAAARFEEHPWDFGEGMLENLKEDADLHYEDLRRLVPELPSDWSQVGFLELENEFREDGELGRSLEPEERANAMDICKEMQEILGAFAVFASGAATKGPIGEDADGKQRFEFEYGGTVREIWREYEEGRKMRADIKRQKKERLAELMEAEQELDNEAPGEKGKGKKEDDDEEDTSSKKAKKGKEKETGKKKEKKEKEKDEEEDDELAEVFADLEEEMGGDDSTGEKSEKEESDEKSAGSKGLFLSSFSKEKGTKEKKEKEQWEDEHRLPPARLYAGLLTPGFEAYAEKVENRDLQLREDARFHTVDEEVDALILELEEKEKKETAGKIKAKESGIKKPRSASREERVARKEAAYDILEVIGKRKRNEGPFGNLFGARGFGLIPCRERRAAFGRSIDDSLGTSPPRDPVALGEIPSGLATQAIRGALGWSAVLSRLFSSIFVPGDSAHWRKVLAFMGGFLALPFISEKLVPPAMTFAAILAAGFMSSRGAPPPRRVYAGGRMRPQTDPPSPFTIFSTLLVVGLAALSGILFSSAFRLFNRSPIPISPRQITALSVVTSLIVAAGLFKTYQPKQQELDFDDSPGIDAVPATGRR